MAGMLKETSRLVLYGEPLLHNSRNRSLLVMMSATALSMPSYARFADSTGHKDNGAECSLWLEREGTAIFIYRTSLWRYRLEWLDQYRLHTDSEVTVSEQMVQHPLSRGAMSTARSIHRLDEPKYIPTCRSLPREHSASREAGISRCRARLSWEWRARRYEISAYTSL